MASEKELCRFNEHKDYIRCGVVSKASHDMWLTGRLDLKLKAYSVIFFADLHAYTVIFFADLKAYTVIFFADLQAYTVIFAQVSQRLGWIAVPIQRAQDYVIHICILLQNVI